MMSASAQPEWAAELLKKVDMNKLVLDIRQFEKDDKWLKENLTELRKKYPNKFIAIYDRNIVGVGEALQDAQEKVRAAGFDPTKCVIQLILTEDYIWVL